MAKCAIKKFIFVTSSATAQVIFSKVCGCYMARLTLSKNSNSASLTILLYRLFTLLSTDGDNNNASATVTVTNFHAHISLNEHLRCESDAKFQTLP